MQPIFFDCFCLDPLNHRLLRHGEAVPITPKAFRVHHLLQHPNTLVSVQQVLASVWPRVCVVPSSVKVYIREIRQALGTTADTRG